MFPAARLRCDERAGVEVLRDHRLRVRVAEGQGRSRQLRVLNVQAGIRSVGRDIVTLDERERSSLSMVVSPAIIRPPQQYQQPLFRISGMVQR